MESVYIVDCEIRPWGALSGSGNSGKMTLTVVTLNKEDMSSLLLLVFELLQSLFSRFYRWHTLGAPFHGSKIQLRQLKKDLTRDCPGFANVFAGEVPSSGIWCSASEMTLPFRQEQLDYLCDGWRTLLVMTYASIDSPQKAWKLLSKLSEGYDQSAIAAFLEENPYVALASACEEDTHMAFQVYGDSTWIRRLEDRLATMGVTRVRHRDEVADFINAG